MPPGDSDYWNLRIFKWTRRKKPKRLTEEEKERLRLEYLYYSQNPFVKPHYCLAMDYGVNVITVKKAVNEK